MSNVQEGREPKSPRQISRLIINDMTFITKVRLFYVDDEYDMLKLTAVLMIVTRLSSPTFVFDVI